MDGEEATVSPGRPVRVDGRRARTIRTHAALVDAVISLQEAGHLKPTAQQIARRAGTSVRSIFQHFNDQDSLTNAVMDELARRNAALAYAVPTDRPLQERLAAFVNARSERLERLAPHRRAANLLEPLSPAIAARRADLRQRRRDEVEAAFLPELQNLPPRRRRELVIALALIAEGETWEGLRRHSGLNVAESRRILRHMLERLLIDRQRGP